MKNQKIILVSILAILTLTLTSCNKNEEGDSSTTATLIVNVTVEGYGAVSGAEVHLIEEPGNTYIQEKITDANGKTTLTNILPGTYSIKFWYVPNSNEEFIGHSDSFQLIAGETKTMSLALD